MKRFTTIAITLILALTVSLSLFTVPAATAETPAAQPSFYDMYNSWLLLVTAEQARYWEYPIGTIQRTIYDNAEKHYAETVLTYYPLTANDSRLTDLIRRFQRQLPTTLTAWEGL